MVVPILSCHVQGTTNTATPSQRNLFSFGLARSKKESYQLGTKGRLNDLLQLKKKKNFLPVSQEQIGSYSCLGSLVDLL